MSKKSRAIRNEIRALEYQVEQLFDLVGRLTENQRKLKIHTQGIPKTVGSAVGGAVAGILAITERNQAAQDHVRVDH
ncbi:hypothetical protein [Agrobacterium tumefaciens]|uniref:hypothetical protein n=1 Tax=Agrobacterium tumefaciens TaxID=358 RepID=UPI001572A29F|nr:hypothetical protein [Agrobacterium tumefaciens]WCJ61884.1 hypothetical protein G6M15_10635 [Agrobacterium tumefaciens]